MTAEPRWVEFRDYPDLDPRAEAALRRAGLAFLDDAAAEAHLAQASAIAGKHEAVLIARYRYQLYKHRFRDACESARVLLERTAAQLGIPKDPMQVAVPDLARVPVERELRAWLFACQAYGYVLMRAGYETAGRAMLDHLVAIDVHDHTRSQQLVAVIDKGGEEDDD